MQTITTIGLDIAKSVFQVHEVDAVGEVVMVTPAATRNFRVSQVGARPGLLLNRKDETLQHQSFRFFAPL
jgi:hypothetical protein